MTRGGIYGEIKSEHEKNPKGFPEGSCYILPYIQIAVIIQTLLISKSYTYNEEIRNRIDPVENSVGAALGNTDGQESNTRKVKFQYHPF